jgi:UDP-N-acetylglucosamine diphosphorylase/glucosamine-1-phosphate N-acetyltransferase
MDLILFDFPEVAEQLQPFTFTRPVSHIRTGILTQRERWELLMGTGSKVFASKDLTPVWPRPESGYGLWVNASWIPAPGDADRVAALKPGSGLESHGRLLAYHVSEQDEFDPVSAEIEHLSNLTTLNEVRYLSRPWEIFSWNGALIRFDFQIITKNRLSKELPDSHTIVYGRENIFIEEGVKIKAAIINAEGGPVYIGKNAEIQEGSIIRGPFALLEGSVVNMGAKIRPDTTVGPGCKVGGEISNAVFFGFANKAHDGFLGNSVIGEWCNLGADSNNSNLKNNYGEVKIYGFREKEMIGTGLQFCGLMMGDHSKCGINTMFNTGTVTGVGCNIFDAGFPPKQIQNFSWGGASEGFEIYRFDKFLEAETRVLSRRNKTFSEGQIEILKQLHRGAESYSLL